MSRDLLVLAAFACICILLNPLFKEQINNTRLSSDYQLVKSKNPISNITNSEVIIKTNHPKKIILMSDSFLPITFAGSELSGYETIKYLRKRGHDISIYVKTHKVESYDSFPIYKYDPLSETCKNAIINSDIILYQMGSGYENMEIVKLRDKNTFIFIHMINSYPWLLQQKVKFPVIIVYNSHMTQDTLPTFYSNMRMIPYVDMSQFKLLRSVTVQNNVVCLINCNKNKGGDILVEIANKMTNVQFIGVKGGYSDQIYIKDTPNLTYIENQKDIKVVLRQIGILIMPSKNETWGRTAVEAMASGIPVIHSEAGGLVECVGGAGILCYRDDLDSWCEAISHLTGDPAYRESLRQKGFKRVIEIEQEQIRGRQELARKIEV
jgi:glycosyltransferase involved in cell wall biosynthesis